MQMSDGQFNMKASGQNAVTQNSSSQKEGGIDQ